MGSDNNNGITLTIFIHLSRIFKSGWLSFVRNIWLSTATISVFFLVLFVIAGLLFLSFATTHVAQILEDKVDITVYFSDSAPEPRILDVQSQLLEFEEIKSVEYVSRSRALETFKERHKDNPLIQASLEELDENPLLASLNVKAYEASTYEAVAQFLEGGTAGSLVEKIDYRENKELIERLFTITGNIKRAGVAVSALLSFVALLVAFNTIRLAIYNERDSIAIMRLVGAGNWFIRGPFVVQGMLVGISAAVLSMVVVAVLVYTFSDRVNAFIPGLNLLGYLRTNFLLILALEAGVGVALGSLGSLIAIRNYLKV